MSLGSKSFYQKENKAQNDMNYRVCTKGSVSELKTKLNPIIEELDTQLESSMNTNLALFAKT